MAMDTIVEIREKGNKSKMETRVRSYSPVANKVSKTTGTTPRSI